MASPTTGGVSVEEIRQFMADEPHPPTLAGASLQTKFVRRVADLVAARAGAGELGHFSVFLMSEALADDVEGRDCEEFPFIQNGQDELSGQVWLSSAHLGTAFRCNLEWKTQASLFQAIKSASLGSLPALVVDWRTAVPMGIIYPNGVADSDTNSRVIFENVPISPPDLQALLGRFWQKCLRTPGLSIEGHAMKVWEKASKGVPAPRPEERIHGRLLDTIKTHYTQHDVRAEVVNDDGRIDILIWSMTVSGNGSKVQRNEWVLELKALADRTSTDGAIPPAAVEASIVGGLEQAIQYRSRVHAIYAALCCFDMRKEDVGDAATFAGIMADASASQVEMWRWYLYRSSALARKAAVAAMS